MEGGLRFDGSDILLPYFFKGPAQLGSYAGPGTMTCLVEPRATFDDMAHAFEEVQDTFKGTYLNAESLYTPPAQVDLGTASGLPTCR